MIESIAIGSPLLVEATSVLQQSLKSSSDDSIIPHNHGLSQEGQGRQYELLSPTQVLSGQVQNLDNNHKEQKKKKYHGNRKKQHKRRRLRRQQQKVNNTTKHKEQNIITVVNSINNHPNQEERDNYMEV